MRTSILLLALVATAALVTVPAAEAAEFAIVDAASDSSDADAAICIPLIGCFLVCTPDGTCFW